MSITAYACDGSGNLLTSLTGGGSGALDSLDGADLNDNDMAFVFDQTNDVYRVYYLDDDSGVAESSPDVISPDSNAGNKRWILVLRDAAADGSTKGIAAFDADDFDASGGVVSLSGTIDLTGGQIAFPATAVPSADANTLDDYEEGTHTVTITCSTSGSYTLDSGVDTLSYTKIGRVAHIQGYLSITGESSPNGQLRISIPFTPTNLTEDSDKYIGSAVIGDHGGNISGHLVARGEGGQTYIRLYFIASDGTTLIISHGDVDTAFHIYLSVLFIVE